MTIRVPAVGEEIYVPTLEPYGLIGGLARVKQLGAQCLVEQYNIVIEEWPDNIILRWELLEPYQSELKESFGLKRADLAPDFEERQKQLGDSCPIK